jgi:DNA helicase-2/ATP-dependent DNA helicase PcrA
VSGILHLIVPRRFFTSGQSSLGDRIVYACRKRFIPAALLPLLERLTLPIAAPEASSRADARQASTLARVCAACGGREKCCDV